MSPRRGTTACRRVLYAWWAAITAHRRYVKRIVECEVLDRIGADGTMAMSATNATAILETQAVSLCREGRTILRDVGVRVMQREIHALLGVNGCGKSSLAYALMGCADEWPDAGRIRFDGCDITELPIHARARLGLTLAWQ